jgi:uncharacterized membrane protein YbaN (DUF454 family)
LKRILLLGLGWLLIVVGIVGYPIPFFQSTICILVGLAILAEEYEWAHRWLHRIRTKFPRMATASDRLKARLRRKPPLAAVSEDETEAERADTSP